MEYRSLGNTDLEVSSIGMGCVTLGREIDRSASFHVLDHALERGITLFDTAEAYAAGESETVLGEWMAARQVRDRIVVATKVSGTLTRERVISTAEASLVRLKTDRIDLFQLHSWDDKTPLRETLEALAVLVKQGKVRHVGCSNWMAWHLCKGLLLAQHDDCARMRSVQPPYNLVQREIEPDVLPLCADQEIGVISYSPLAAGFLTGKYQRGQDVPTGTRFDVIPGHQCIYFTDHGYAVLGQLERVAAQSGRSTVQLALAWVLRRPGIASALVGARSAGHIDQAFEAEQTDLGDELIQQLEGTSG